MPAIIPLIIYAAEIGGYIGAVTAAVLIVVSSIAISYYERRKAEADARAAAYASLQDRQITVRSGVAPRQYIFGTARTGGALMYIETVGTKREALDAVIAVANNQCVLNTWFLGDDRVEAADFPGSKYGRVTYEWKNQQYVISGASGTVATSFPVSTSAGRTCRASYTSSVVNSFGIAKQGIATVVVNNPTSVTISGMPAGTNNVNLTYSAESQGVGNLRGQFKTGTNAQTTTDWAGYSTPSWTANHRLRGTAYVRTLMIWDQNIYPAGAPAVNVAVTGRCIDGLPFLDPRDSSHPTDTFNPAILALYWMTVPRRLGGCGIPLSWIDLNAAAAAAIICDESVTYKKLDGSGYESKPRYQCHTLLYTSATPLDNLDIILSSMAGRRCYTGGLYRIFAGAFVPAAVTITDNDVIGTQPITISTSLSDGDPPNMATCRFADAANDWGENSPTVLRNDSYVTLDGTETSIDLNLAATTDSRYALYLMGIAIERQRPAYSMTLFVRSVGENLALYDSVQFSLINYSFLTGHTFEVTKIVDQWDGTFQVSLSETKSSTYSLNPDTFLPTTPFTPPDLTYLWHPPELVSFQIISLTPTTLPDGTAVMKVGLSWSTVATPGNTEGARIELRYQPPGGQYISAGDIPGDQVGSTITAALIQDTVYRFEARFVNSIGAASHWVDAIILVNGLPLPFTGWNLTGSALMNERSMTKPGSAVAAWDSGGFTDQAHSLCHVVGKTAFVGATARFMLGLSDTPAASVSFTNMDYGWSNQTGAVWQIYESGTQITTVGAAATTDVVDVTYDGANVRYHLNGILKRTVATAGRTFFGFAALFDPFATINYIGYGPTANILLNDTGDINSNAATSTSTVFVTGPVSVAAHPGGPPHTEIAHITVGPFPTDVTLVATVSGQWDNTTGGGLLAYSINTTTQYNPATAIEITAVNNTSGIFSSEGLFSLAAGVTQDYYVEGTMLPTNAVGAFALTNVMFKVEAIKR